MQYIVRFSFPNDMKDAVDEYLLDKPGGVNVSFVEVTKGNKLVKRTKKGFKVDVSA